MTLENLVEVGFLSINKESWKVYVDKSPEPLIKGAFWIGDTKEKTITIRNVDYGNKDFADYMVWKFMESARMQYSQSP